MLPLVVRRGAARLQLELEPQSELQSAEDFSEKQLKIEPIQILFFFFKFLFL